MTPLFDFPPLDWSSARGVSASTDRNNFLSVLTRATDFILYDFFITPTVQRPSGRCDAPRFLQTEKLPGALTSTPLLARAHSRRVLRDKV